MDRDGQRMLRCQAILIKMEMPVMIDWRVMGGMRFWDPTMQRWICG